MNKLQRQQMFQMALENYERNENAIKLEALHESNQAKAFEEEVNNALAQSYNFVSKANKYNKFLNSIKESLVYDVIHSIYTEAFGTIKTGAADPKYDGLKDSLVKSFIAEHSNNIDGLINKMKYKSEMLSEMAVIIEETVDKIKKDTDKDDESSYILDTSIKDDFFDKLNMAKPDDVISTIRHRVSDAVEDFITQNTADKLEIADIMQQAKERIDSTNSDTMKEQYNYEAKRKISEIHNKPKDLLTSMVYNLSESAYKNENMSKFKTVSGTVDMDAIVETCEVMYTFLETLNTVKLVELSEDDIQEVLNNLKK